MRVKERILAIRLLEIAKKRPDLIKNQDIYIGQMTNNEKKPKEIDEKIIT